MIDRKEGYYWVKYEGQWHVAQYRHTKVELPFGDKDSGAWTLAAYVDDSWWFYDSDFEEINEKRIEREER